MDKKKKPLRSVTRQIQDIQLEETVAGLKREKATKNTAFTKVRRCLLTIIQRKEGNIQELKDICDELDVPLENVMNVMDRFFDRYKDSRNSERLGEEIEQIEIKYINV